MMSNKELIVDKENMYRIIEDSSGKLFISVLCGGIAMYELKFELNSIELEGYQSQGKIYLEQLAQKVARQTGEYEDRAV